jgi:hypothetical protein
MMQMPSCAPPSRCLPGMHALGHVAMRGAENIWPRLQSEATQPSFRPPRSNIANGDLRIGGFITSYSTTFDAPFVHMSKVRSPMRNPDLAQATDLHPLYLSSFNRVTECVLSKASPELSHQKHLPDLVHNTLCHMAAITTTKPPCTVSTHKRHCAPADLLLVCLPIQSRLKRLHMTLCTAYGSWRHETPLFLYA